MPRFPHRFLHRPLIPIAGLALCLGLGLSPALSQQAATETGVPQTMEAIEQAWAGGDFAAVRAGLERLATAEGASALAQYRYARVLLEGRGGPRDNVTAEAMLEAAVAQNHLPAHTLLARMLMQPRSSDETGEVPAEPERAAALLKSAAARGEAEAQYYLALAYRAGRGVDQDLTEAFTWMLAAAEKQYAPAQYEMARIYSRGEGVEASNEEAIRWLTEAAQANVAEAQFFLAEAYRLGRGVTQNKREAVAWYTRAGQQGHLLSARMVGTAYMTGDGVTQDFAIARQWLEAAAKAGEAGAQLNLAVMYDQGLGVEADPTIAVEWYAKAAQKDVPQAITAFAAMLVEGRGIGADRDRGLALYRKAAEAGHAPAILRLAEMTIAGELEGEWAPQTAVPWVMLALASGTDVAGARGWLEAQSGAGNRDAQAAFGGWLADNGEAEAGAALLAQAAQAGEVASQARLGRMHTTGDGVALDYVAAHRWLNIAATGGDPTAAELRATVTELMTPEEVARAQTEARAWLDAARARAPRTEQQVTVTEPATGVRE